MSKDSFGSSSTRLEAPATNAASITPNDSVDLDFVSRALWVGTAGDIKVVTAGGQTVTFASASGWMPVRVTRVFSTDTTASNIVSVW